jgi:hypothetical protein
MTTIRKPITLNKTNQSIIYSAASGRGAAIMSWEILKGHTLRLLIFFSLAASLLGCSKSEVNPAANNYTGTTWATEDVAANIIYGGENYLHLKFIDNSTYEIVELRGGVVKGLSEEGEFSLSNDDRDVTLRNSKNNSLRVYRQIDSRTLQALVNGQLADKYSPYATYTKQ